MDADMPPKDDVRSVRRGIFDECAGNFTHKRLKAVLWLVVVVAFFAAIRWYYISRLNQVQAGVEPPSAAERAGGTR